MLTPHLGASTDEAEENCAVMAANQLMRFLETGSIVNSVNFPAVSLEAVDGYRVAISNHNVPGMLGQMTAVLGERNINVIDLINKSRDDLAYNLIDLSEAPDEGLLQAIRRHRKRDRRAGYQGRITRLQSDSGPTRLTPRRA